MYRRNSDDALGGRHRPFAFYFDSMRRLAHFGTAWVVYTDPDDAEEVHGVARTIAPLVDVVPRALTQVPRFEQIQALRERLGVRFLPYRDRCHVLCFGKVGWVAAEAAAPRFGSERVYWIDAGLAHEGLFPRRLYERPESLFTPAALQTLDARSSLTLLAHPLSGELQHDVSVSTMAAVTGLKEPPRQHVIGGLFGGQRLRVLELAVEFYRLHAALLGAELLGTEENVLSLIAAAHPEIPVETFDSWYHEDTDFTQPPPGARSFYRIFEDWACLQFDTPAWNVIGDPVVSP